MYNGFEQILKKIVVKFQGFCIFFSICEDLEQHWSLTFLCYQPFNSFARLLYVLCFPVADVVL